MPELPEVELMARSLQRAVGRTLCAVEVPDLRLKAAAALQGHPLEAVERRGKTLLLRLGPLWAAVHPRMTGRLLWRDPGESPKARLRLHFENCEQQLVFDDPRRLGTVVVGAEAMVLESMPRLGPEPWPAALSGTALAACFAGQRRPIKVALLDQARLAGVGNIGAAEGCWRAQIAPHRLPETLRPEEWAALAMGIHAWASGAIAAVGDGELELIHAGGDNPFAVYGRGGAPCSRCGATLRSAQLAGRGTVWCARCQR